jgi:hypothetical protein
MIGIMENLPARFLRMIPVEDPDQPLPFGGRVQILGIELYDSCVGVAYRLAPLPNVESVMREVLADHDKGTEHLPDQERKRLRGKFELRMNRAAETGIVLTDDLGTAYHATSSHGGGGGNERVGRTQFVPPIPREVTQLVVHWGELEFPVDLTPETMITPAPVRRDEVPPSGTSGLEPQGQFFCGKVRHRCLSLTSTS